MFYLFTFAISLSHRKFVTADVTKLFVNNINVVFNDDEKILIKTHKYTQKHSYTCREIKIGTLKMQFASIFFYMC